MRSRTLWPLALAIVAAASAQDRLPTMPRYDRYEKLRREIQGSIKRGSVIPTWAEDSKSFTYSWDGKTYRYSLADRKATEGEAEKPRATGGRRQRGNPDRGRQFSVVYSEDGKQKATYRDRNVYLSDADGKNEVAVSSDGSEAARTKNGVASWVYGEELYVREAMWFSPDGKYLAYYHFDETPVKDYWLVLDQTKFQGKLDTEAYPKAGQPNPKVELRVYDVEAKRTIAIDPTFGDGGKELGEYVYQVRWSPDGKELFYHRTNRKQNTMEWCAASPATGASRVVIRESQPDAWTDNAPPLRYLADNQRFLWTSERNGYKNLYLYDLTGKQIATVTNHKFDVESVVQVDEAKGLVYYTARSGANPYLMQLHVVGLDGKGDRRITDPALNHTVFLSPDGAHLVDIAENLDTPAATRVLDANGKVLSTLVESDLSKFKELKLRKTERITFPAADGQTTLYGRLQFPSDFDPRKRYPVVIGTYAGPESGGDTERFGSPDPITELGFIVASFEGRGTSGRGKAFKDAVYGKLGVVEIDDQAAGAKYLAGLRYVDPKRIGIHGTSYGGYTSAMAILRHPDVFAAASASSSVTDWRHYDTIYTERYMGLPWENENLKGYEAGSAMTYVKNLKGRLMLYFGSADNNVHPSNTLMLAQALNRAGKSYEMMVGPDQGHTGLNFARMWEFFIENLVLKTPSSQPIAKRVSGRRKA